MIREPAPLLSTINPNAPADLQRIVRRCLAKDPDERYQNIKDVAIELKEVRRDVQDNAKHCAAGLVGRQRSANDLEVGNYSRAVATSDGRIADPQRRAHRARSSSSTR